MLRGPSRGRRHDPPRRLSLPVTLGVDHEVLHAPSGLVPGPRVITINRWNEWTEGGHLEPDTSWLHHMIANRP